MRSVLIKLASLGLVALHVAMSRPSMGQVGEFTYQGFLTTENAPANGLFDIQFDLFDALSNGTRVVASPVVISDIAITNGLFTTTLDFGVTSIVDLPLWMELSVRVADDAGSYATLSPRQRITPVPFAVRAASFSGPVDDGQISSNIARLNTDLVFTGVLQLTNPSNIYAGDGAGLKRTSLLQTADYLAAAGATQLVVIANRSDGRDGTGTMEDPRDGSTQQKYDAIIQSLANSTNAVVYLRNGVYETVGWCQMDYLGTTYPKGCSLIGESRDGVIIRQSATTSNYVIHTITEGLVPVTGVAKTNWNLKIRHLTVDGNAQNLSLTPKNNIEPITTYSENTQIEDVRVINARAGLTAATGGVARECFAVGVFGTNSVVSGVVVEKFQPAIPGSLGSDGIAVGPWVVVSGCYVDMRGTVVNGGTSGIQYDSWSRITGCTVVNSLSGIAYDTPAVVNAMVDGNILFNVRFGINATPAAGGSTTNSTIANNRIQISHSGVGILLNSTGDTLNEVIVHDNSITYANPSYSGGVAFVFKNAINCHIYDNFCANDMTASVTASILHAFNNRRFDGSAIPSLEDNIITGNGAESLEYHGLGTNLLTTNFSNIGLTATITNAGVYAVDAVLQCEATATNGIPDFSLFSAKFQTNGVDLFLSGKSNSIYSGASGQVVLSSVLTTTANNLTLSIHARSDGGGGVIHRQSSVLRTLRLR